MADVVEPDDHERSEFDRLWNELCDRIVADNLPTGCVVTLETSERLGDFHRLRSITVRAGVHSDDSVIREAAATMMTQSHTPGDGSSGSGSSYTAGRDKKDALVGYDGKGKPVFLSDTPDKEW